MDDVELLVLTFYEQSDANKLAQLQQEEEEE